MPRIKTSSGVAAIPIAIGTGWGGESNEFKRDNEIRMQTILFGG